MKNITSLLLPLFLCSSVFGQKAETNASRTTLEEIAVQGTQLEELDLSRATVLGSSELESRKAQTLGDLSGLAPNLYLSENGIKSFGDVLIIRGIGNTQFFGSPGVQMYIDGVPQGNVFSYGSDLYDLEAVEVLKGPQLSRFGKLAPGGAINLITRKPGDEQINRVSASYATFNTQKYDLASSGPMDGDLSYSLAVQRSSSDGFLNNSAGRDNDSESWNGNLKLYWDGGAGTRATLGLSFVTHELGAQPLVKRDGGDFYDRTSNANEYTEIDQNQQYLTIEHDLDDLKLISITNRNDWNMNPNVLDIDLNATAAMTSTIIQDQSTWSQEIRFESQEGDNLNWTAGLFYSDDEIEGTATRDIGIGQLMNTTYSLESENLGAFGSIIRNLTDQDDLQLSLRADRYKKSISRTGPALSFPSPTFFPTLTDVSHAFSKNQNSIAGTLSWNHQFSDITSIRSTIGYSEKPGGYSAFSNEATETEFSEEKITSYEVSLKLNPSEGWALTISPFYNEIRDYQFELNGAGLTDYYLENADEVSVYGVEVDSSWLLEGGWAFSASYGLMESEFEKVSALPALNGKQLGFVPSHSLSLLLSHDLENGLSYQIGSRTIGKSYYWNNTGTNSADNIGTYTLIDAGIGYEINDWDLTVFGSNLTDEEYYTSLVSSLGFASAPGIAGSPRVIGLSISREF